MKMALVIWKMIKSDVKYRCHKAQKKGKRISEKKKSVKNPAA